MADSKLNVTVNPQGAVSGAQKVVKALNNIGKAAQRAEDSLKKLDGRAIRIKVDGRALSQLRTTAESTRKAVEAISKVTVRPKVDARALTNLRNAAQRTATALRQINRISVTPKTSVGGLNTLQRAADKTKAKLKEVNNTKIDPKVSATGLQALQTSVATTSKQMVALSAQTSAYGAVAVKTGAVASASLLNVSKSANLAAASVGRLSAAQATLGASSAIRSAGAAVTGGSIGAGLNAVGASRGIGGLTGKLGKASLAARGFGLAIKAGGVALAAFGVATGIVAGNLIAITLKFSDAAIMIRNRIRLVTDSTEELNQVTAELFRQSRDARVQLTAQAELYQRIGLSMEQLGASTESVLAATEATAKAITLSAVSYQAANATIIQFGQALAFGKLRGDELRSVLEQSPRLAQALADGLGIARGELIKFGFAGKLASDRVFDALISQLPVLREEFKEITPRISEAKTVLDNALIRLSGAVNDSTGLSDAFAGALLSLADTISGNTPKIINGLLEIQLAWINLKSLVQTPIDWAKGLGESFWDALPTDQDITQGPFYALADGIDWFNSKVGNWKEIRIAGDLFRDFGDDVETAVRRTGEAIADIPEMVTPDIPNIAWIGLEDAKETYDRAVELARDVNAISIERKELQIDINARDAARRAQNALDGLQTEIDGYLLQSNIDIEVNAAEAEIKLPKVEKDLDRLREEKIRLNVQLDMPAAEDELRDLNDQLNLFQDKDDVIYAQLEKKRDAYAKIVDAVKLSGQYIQENDKWTDEQRKKVELMRDALGAINKILAEVPSDASALGSSREDLQQQRDPTADTRAINSFINKQKELIVELNTQEGIERDLALLRLDAGDAAVDGAEQQIRANQDLIDSKQKLRDIEDDLKDASESLDEDIQKAKDLSEAERLRLELGKLRVRTVEEQAAAETAQIEDYLTGLVDIDEKLKKNILSEEKLALIRELSNTVSAADKARIENEIKLLEIKQRQLYTEEKLKEIRDDVLKDATKRVEEGDRSSAAAERLHEIEEIQERIAKTRKRISDIAKKKDSGVFSQEQQDQLATMQEALELYLMDLKEAQSLFQDFSVDSVELIREMAQQMTSAMEDFFFDIMQGNFDNLLNNLANSWKAAIDRMVAQALAARLAEKLFGGKGSFGDILNNIFFGKKGPAGKAPTPTTTSGGFGIPGVAKGGFIKPNALVEVNELGQEALLLGAHKFLIPTGNDVNRMAPPELMGNLRGLESGGFARPNETVEINERSLEALRMGNLTSILGRLPYLEGGTAKSAASGQGATKGSFVNGTALGGAALVSFPGSFPPPSPERESLPQGGIAHFYHDSAMRVSQGEEIGNNNLPNVYNVGGRTFLRMGSSGGFVIPHDKTRELVEKEVMGKIPGREFGGAVQSRSVFEVNEGVLPELLSIGSRDFLLTGGSSGFVTPMDSASELGMRQNVNITIVTPDVDGFRKTQGQIQNELGRAANLANRRNG